MAKAYWVVCYRSISDPAAREEYTKLAIPAVLAGGGRYLARGGVAKTYEAGINQRTVLVEFDRSPPTTAPATRRHSLSWAMRRSATFALSMRRRLSKRALPPENASAKDFN